jgi:hypothetical protein
LNPAIALSELGSHNWVWTIYVLGPVLGGLIAYSLYQMLFLDTVLGVANTNDAIVRPSSVATSSTSATAPKPVVKRVEKPVTKTKAAKVLATNKPATKRKTAPKKK